MAYSVNSVTIVMKWLLPYSQRKKLYGGERSLQGKACPLSVVVLTGCVLRIFGVYIMYISYERGDSLLPLQGQKILSKQNERVGGKKERGQLG